MRFSKKKFFLKSRKVVNLLYNAYQMQLFLENVFSALIMRIFWQKKRKIFIWKKLENMKERFFFKKKHFHLFKSLLYKNGKPENMPGVADRFVYYSFWSVFNLLWQFDRPQVFLGGIFIHCLGKCSKVSLDPTLVNVGQFL